MRHFSTIGILALVICIVPFLYIPESIARVITVGFSAIIFCLAYVSQRVKETTKAGKDRPAKRKSRQPYDIEDPRRKREIT